jgi:hypothetical protein
MENVGVFYDHLKYFMYGHLVYLMVVWYSFLSFDIFFPFWYVWAKKNLATLDSEYSVLRKQVFLLPLFQKIL